MHVHAYIVWNRKCPIFCYRGSTIKISSQIWTPSPSFLSRHTLIPLFPSVPLPRRHPSAPLLCIHHSLLLELIRERAQQRFSFLPMYARQDRSMHVSWMFLRSHRMTSTKPQDILKYTNGSAVTSEPRLISKAHTVSFLFFVFCEGLSWCCLPIEFNPWIESTDVHTLKHSHVLIKLCVRYRIL